MHQDPTQAIAHYGEEAITAIFPIFYLTPQHDTDTSLICLLPKIQTDTVSSTSFISFETNSYPVRFFKISYELHRSVKDSHFRDTRDTFLTDN